MDKRGIRIICLGCILSTALIAVLFVLAIRYTKFSCELVRMDQQQQASVPPSSFVESQPILSDDKSMLIKISAYLEYNLPLPPGSSQRALENSTLVVAQQPASPASQQQPMVTGVGPLSLQPQQQHPSQLATALNQHQQQQNSATNHNNNFVSNDIRQYPSSFSQFGGPTPAGTLSTNGNNHSAIHVDNNSLGSSSLAAATQPATTTTTTNITRTMIHTTNSGDQARAPVGDRRFLPLELNAIKMKRLNETTFKYTLNFNCSIMKLIVVRNERRVQVQKASLELRPSSRHQSNCELKLGPRQRDGYGGELGADVGPTHKLAHYYCERPMRFRCWHNSTVYRHPLLLADLHIQALEFETGSNTTAGEIHTTDAKFLSEKKNCTDWPPAGAVVGGVGWKLNGAN